MYLVAGTLGVWLLQVLKKLFQLKGRAMLWASVLVSLALGAITSIVTQDGGLASLLANPWLILTGGGTVFATATVIYKEVAKKMQLPDVAGGGGA